MRSFRYLFASVAIMSTFAAPGASAQSNGQSALLLAVSAARLPKGVMAMVVRTANAAQPDLVILAPDATSEQTLPGALSLLRRLRINEPVARSSQVHYVELAATAQPLSAGDREKLAPQLARAAAQLASTHNGERRNIPGIGDARVIATTLGDSR